MNMNTPHKNPLLTPFVLPPFDKIQDTDFEPAMIQGIKESEKPFLKKLKTLALIKFN